MKVRRSFSSGRRVRKPLSVSLLTVLAMTLLSSERRLVILCFFDSFCAFLSRVYRFSGFRISDGGPAFYGGRLFGLRFRRHDAGRRCAAAACGDQSILVLTATMLTFPVLETGRHLLIAGYLFGLGYGILQPLFQSFVTDTTEPPFRGAANATYMLSYDIGIGLGALLTGFLSEQIGIARSFAVTAAAFPVGALVYALYCDRYYRIRKDLYDEAEKEAPAAGQR